MRKILVMLLVSTFGYATVSEYNNYYIPYQRIQSEYICLDQQTMRAVYGIPLASLLIGVLSETKTLIQQTAGSRKYTYENINLLAMDGKQITSKLNFDRYTSSGVSEYSFVLDLSQFSALSDQEIINKGKLAVISILKTAEKIFGAGKFRIWIRFIGLPTQTGSGFPLISHTKGDWPNWPYTASSPVYATYLKEMIHPSCQ